MSAACIIPARHASTRFPGKPLALIAGVPMVQRVFERARQAKRISEVYVATDDDRIAEACAGFGAPVLMTSPDHPTGTDRLAEAASRLDHEVIVNVQGDEPLIEGFVIDAAVDALLEDADTPISTVVHPLEGDARHDPNRVKVVLDRAGFALYFSRSPIPYERGEAGTTWQHVGLYAYRRPFLQDFVSLPRTPAERAEELEQLRALEHGHRIRVAIVEGWRSVPVDVPADIASVEALLAESKGGSSS
jgi:3-deoxy-manno-octulosonate cytidylyltransferase (CMP-KDO synthetase)